MWKLPICIVSVGLWLGTLALVHAIASGESTDATKYILNGEQVFAIRSNKTAWVGVIAFPTFFAYPIILMKIFWRPYFAEHKQAKKAKDTEQKPDRITLGCMYAIVGLLVTFYVLVTVRLSLLIPFRAINQISFVDDEIKLASLYTSWSISRKDVEKVQISKELGEARGGGTEVNFVAIISVKDGRQFATNRDVSARPAGGADDKRLETYFEELRVALTK